MKFDMHSTPLPSSRTGLSIFATPSGTALLGEIVSDIAGPTIIVRTNVIRAYEETIFQLERQVLHYQNLLKNLERRPTVTAEDEAEMSSPLNAASIELINSVLRARVPNDAYFRADDDDEEG
jgi:hypothetical protein